MRYIGTIKRLRNQNCGFIDRKSVTRADGLIALLETTKDIFIHNDDAEEWIHLEVGEKLTFEITDDEKRPDALRATRIRMPSQFPIKEGIELHFDTRVIDHPTVPIRWCIKPEIFELIRAEKDHHWAVVLVAQSRQRDPEVYERRRVAYQTVLGMLRIGDGRDYFTFPAPGDYDLVVYLVNSFDERQLKEQLESAQRGHYDVWNGDELQTESRRLSFISRSEKLIALSHTQVSVPEGIFAKPLPEFVKNWIGYFGLQRPHDECSMRGRIAFAFTLGVAWYAIWELVKRSYILLIGIGHFLIGGNPFAVWKEALVPRLSALISDPRASDEFKPLMDYSGWKALLHPALITPVVGLTGTYALFPDYREDVYLIIGVIAVIAVITFASVMISERAQTRKWKIMKEQAAAAAEKGELALARIEANAVCGRQVPDKGPVTVRLVWTGIKRRVCRTYA